MPVVSPGCTNFSLSVIGSMPYSDFYCACFVSHVRGQSRMHQPFSLCYWFLPYSDFYSACFVSHARGQSRTHQLFSLFYWLYAILYFLSHLLCVTCPWAVLYASTFFSFYQYAMLSKNVLSCFHRHVDNIELTFFFSIFHCRPCLLLCHSLITAHYMYCFTLYYKFDASMSYI